MTPQDPTQLTRLLGRLGRGDADADNELLELVYDRLRSVARRLFEGERAGHTLQPTAVVHEAWAKLVREDGADWQNRAQFFAVGATVMRRILVDYARARSAAKRGGGAGAVPLSTISGVESLDSEANFLDLDRALKKLERLENRQHRIVELRFFSGLTVPEVADCLGLSTRTIEAEWTMAKAWLKRELGRGLTE